MRANSMFARTGSQAMPSIPCGIIGIVFGMYMFQLISLAQTVGPDAVAEPGDGNVAFYIWGCVDEIQSYSMRGGVTNFGDEVLPADMAGEHPMWTSNFYRLHESRFEQIGMSWIKHDDWRADGLPESCEPSIECDLGNNNDSDRLDPGCTDVYTCWNGLQDHYGFWLGPRSQVNPWSGYWPPSGDRCNPNDGLLACRLQITKADVNPESYDEAQYFLEQQVIMPGESTAVRGNNVSFKSATVGSCQSGLGFCSGSLCEETRDCQGTCECVHSITPFDSPTCQEPAIHAWHDIDSSVVETEFSVTGDGKFILAAKAWPVGEGLYQYEYALYNMNVNRAAGKFSVQLPTNFSSGERTAIAASAGFHDISHHSGDGVVCPSGCTCSGGSNNGLSCDDPPDCPGGACTGGTFIDFDGTDWPPTVVSGLISWETTAYTTSQNANALRWGTLYNFRFVAPRKPLSTSTVTVYPFKTGTPSSVTGTSLAPNADPLRACCYGGDSCEVDTEDECNELSGYWTNSTSCYTAGCAMRPGE